MILIIILYYLIKVIAFILRLAWYAFPAISILFFLSIAESSFFGYSEAGKIKLPRRSRLFRLFGGKLYDKVEDYLSHLNFLFMADLKGLIIVFAYSAIIAVLRVSTIFLEKNRPEGWEYGCLLLGIILIIMMLALAARYIYEGNRIRRELLPFAFVALIISFFASSAISYGTVVLEGFLAELFMIVPTVAFALVLLSMLVTFIIRAIKDNKKKNPA